MRRMILAAVTTATIVGLLLPIGCGSKGDPAVTGAGLSKEEALNRLRVVNDLRQMAIAADSYTGNYHDRLPPADGSGAEPWGAAGQNSPRRLVGLSWRVHLLEFMESDQNQPGQERTIYTGLRDGKYTRAPNAGPDDAWNVPELKTTRLAIVACPVPDKTTEPWHTFYRVFIGNGTAFESGKQLTWNDFPDGRDKTILIVEAGEAVPWPKPEELPYDPAKPLPKLGGMFPDGFYAVFADGTVRFIKNGTDEKLLRALITRNGGEPVADLPPKVDTEALRRAAGLKD